MGLLFNESHLKRVRDDEIDIQDIRDLSKKLNFNKYGARMEFQNMMIRAQSGGITRQEVFDVLETIIEDGKMSEDEAKEIAGRLGLPPYMIRRFKDMSELRHREYVATHEKAPVEEENREV